VPESRPSSEPATCVTTLSCGCRTLYSGTADGIQRHVAAAGVDNRLQVCGPLVTWPIKRHQLRFAERYQCEELVL
jgi:hypothetical protein